MRIRCLYQGKETTINRPAAAVVIGRPQQGVAIDLDLTPDLAVSRPHARITLEDDQLWIEDLGSKRGTQVDGQEIKGRGKWRLAAQSSIQISETVLRIESPVPSGASVDASDTAQAVPDSKPALPVSGPSKHSVEPDVNMTISGFLPIEGRATPALIQAAETTAGGQQRLLFDLLMQLGTEVPLERFLENMVERLVASIPGAQRGAILIKDPASGQLLLKAHVPSGQPAVSSALADQAMTRRAGFIWQRERDMTVSQIEHRMESGMYAPLVWKGEALGVACVDNAKNSQAFQNESLELFVAVAQYAALVLANQTLHDDLRHNVSLVERLLTNFSPAVRRRLVEKARRGRLRLGGEKSEVTILSSDIRGFTRTTAAMDAEDVVDMLNDYFSALVDAIFRHDGSIDKFIGDGILAVFGSPEPVENPQLKAVRAALAMQVAIGKVNDARRGRGQTVCEIGIGVHCGPVLHGFVGSEERMEFTVIGDAVNRASRYCDGAGRGEVLISPELHQHVWKSVTTELVMIPTKHEGPLKAYRVQGEKSELGPAT